jgi:hypothetical protein
MTIASLETGQLKELLNKGWMTHDAMWFYNCLQEVGIEKTNKINRAAVKMMAAGRGDEAHEEGAGCDRDKDL